MSTLHIIANALHAASKRITCRLNARKIANVVCFIGTVFVTAYAARLIYETTDLLVGLFGVFALANFIALTVLTSLGWHKVAKTRDDIDQLLNEHHVLWDNNKELIREINSKKKYLASLKSRIIIDEAYDACEINPANTIESIDQYAKEAKSAAEAFKAFDAIGDEDDLTPYIYKSADGRIRPIFARWVTYDTTNARRGVAFYDTRGRNITPDDLCTYTPDDWYQVDGEWVCSANRFGGFAKGDPFIVDNLDDAARYHGNAYTAPVDPYGLWLENSLAMVNHSYRLAHKKLDKEQYEKRKRFDDAFFGLSSNYE